MCQRRTVRAKKGSLRLRQREALRLERISTSDAQSSSDESSTPARSPRRVDKVAQKRVILELAWKTVALVHKNKLIQQKIIALQKETSEYIASVVNNPDYQQRLLEQSRLYEIYTIPAYLPQQLDKTNNINLELKGNV